MHQFRSQAKRHASSQKSLPTLATTSSNTNEPILPTTTTSAKTTKPLQAGGLSTIHARGGSSSPDPGANHAITGDHHASGDGQHDDGTVFGRDIEKSAPIGVDDGASRTSIPPAPPPLKSENAGAGNPAIESTEENKKTKQPMTVARMTAGCKRFGGHFKKAIFHSWVNVLLVAVPAGIAAEAAGLDASVIFAINAVAIVPLAGLLSHATESVASRLGDTLGALLNVSFGNAVELIIFIIALVKDEIRIVQASLLGSILANLLLILGMAFLLGGLRYREQVYNSTVTQMSACLLSLSVMSLLLPTAFHAAFNEANLDNADTKVLKVSRGTSVVLLLVYGLYLLFQLKSHAYMYESTPQNVIDEESHPGVLHELMNSSSSDDSSSSDSSDSDSSDSGSVATTTKRMKRMFKHKKRRKSSASTSSTQTADQVTSEVTSPSSQEPKDYLHAGSSHSASRTGSAIAATDDADADREDNGATRVYDWATGKNKHHSHDGSKSPERKKRSKKDLKKDIKKERKRQRQAEKAEKEEAARQASAASKEPQVDGQNRVEFAEDVQVAPAASPATAGRLPFNMRPSRPILPSILSNNVFVQPAPNVTPPPARPSGPTRSHSASAQLRRTNSLPDRLNRQVTPASNAGADPVPPYQRSLRHATSGLSAAASDDEDEEPMSRTAAVVLLLCSTALVAVCAEFMVDAIPVMLESSPNISEAFIGLIILPIVGNAAEHVTAVTVAAKNKMDLAIGVAVGSSIQIALFVTPIVVLLGWILDTNMSLYFNIFETVSLFVTAFVVNFLVLDGRSNYLEGSLLIAAYVIIAVGAFFYPDSDQQSSFGGGGGGGGVS